MSRHEYENDHDDDRYEVDDHDDDRYEFDNHDDHHYTSTSTGRVTYTDNDSAYEYGSTSTNTSTGNYAHGYQFAITNGVVTGIAEIERGYAQQERIEYGETWTVNGSQVIKTEVEHGFTQTSVYADQNGDGIFTKVSQSYTPLASSTATNPVAVNSIRGGSDTDDVWNGSASSDHYYGSAGNDFIRGAYGDDDLYGGNDNDDLYGDEGDDHLYGSNGDDHIYGGIGTDDAYYEGSHTEYALMRTSKGIQLVDNNLLRDGTDTLESVERVHFSDVSLAFDVGIGETAGQAYRLYLAALDREPETTGLSNWIAAMDSDMSLTSAATGFINSQEFQSKYGVNTSPEDFVTLLYNNVLNRAPDEQGLASWVNALHNGYSRESVLTGFSESAEFVQQTLQLIGNGIQYNELIG